MNINKLSFKQVIWLTPAAYLIHIVEEAAFGFHSFVSRSIGMEMSFGKFIAANAAIMGVYIFLLVLYTLRPRKLFAHFVLLLVLSAQFANTFFHLILTIGFGEYCPGLISGLVLYIPLTIVIMRRAYQEGYIDKTSGAVLVVLGFVFMWLFVKYRFILFLVLLGGGVLLFVYRRVKPRPRKKTV